MPRIVSLEGSIQIFRHFRVGVPRNGAGDCGIQIFFVTGSDFSVQLQIFSSLDPSTLAWLFLDSKFVIVIGPSGVQFRE